MKKVLLSLLVLAFVVPAMGAVNITLTQGPEPNSVLVGYQCTAGEAVRAWALDLAVSDKALITSSALRQGLTRPAVDDANYYLTPTNASFSTVGGVLRVWNYGSPIVAADVNGCIIEMASLYAANDPCVAHKFGPPSSGTLVKLFVTAANMGCDGVISVQVTGANAKRGGVVLENGTTVAVSLPGALNLINDTGPAAWRGVSQSKGDATGDGQVNLSDLLQLRKSWLKTTADPHGTLTGQYNCAADFNRNGSVNLQDLLVLRQNWLVAGLASCPANCPP